MAILEFNLLVSSLIYQWIISKFIHFVLSLIVFQKLEILLISILLLFAFHFHSFQSLFLFLLIWVFHEKWFNRNYTWMIGSYITRHDNSSFNHSGWDVNIRLRKKSSQMLNILSAGNFNLWTSCEIWHSTTIFILIELFKSL